MDKHLEIFEDIYDIKDNITDGQFLSLNNRLRELVQENKDLRHSYLRIANCENFRRLMEKFPHLENIFRRIDLPFAEEQIYQEYVKDEIILASEILLFLIKKISEKKDRAIISFVLYDFMIKNANFMKDYQFYTKLLVSKFEGLLEDEEYIAFALEYNVNYTRWLDIMKSIIVPEE